jgi:hypothetical protein
VTHVDAKEGRNAAPDNVPDDSTVEGIVARGRRAVLDGRDGPRQNSAQQAARSCGMITLQARPHGQ